MQKNQRQEEKRGFLPFILSNKVFGLGCVHFCILQCLLVLVLLLQSHTYAAIVEMNKGYVLVMQFNAEHVVIEYFIKREQIKLFSLKLGDGWFMQRELWLTKLMKQGSGQRMKQQQ
eukprot:TRINITY_DN724_c1_g1_i3.p4 TRINITY_DN724_c1_g1~~TRINITY_DN724_c1_g1_i3.p4  ORF type:complete len:128 (+),score=8.26 TRINITY_DN724_c1_g1_i3:37-384(+)